MNIEVLDCTLRDGGYINEWQFTNQQIKNIITSLIDAKIDIIECGYLNDTKGKENDTTLFKSMDSITILLQEMQQEFQKVVMINLGDYDIKKLPQKETTLIDGIRLAFHKKDLQEALSQAQDIINLGYNLYFQPMITKNYSDLEFLALIEEVNKFDFKAFYIVDSFGSMTLSEFQKYVILANSNLKENISLGYHSHNNMQLAFSNAITMSNMHLKRDIIIDASIYGIGRGAGNLNTELITDYLNTTCNKHYNTLPLLEIIDILLNSLMQKKSWGFSPAQYLSASFDCHPNYATYLINKNTNHIVGVKKVLENLPQEYKASFNKKVIDTLYLDFLFERKTSVQNNIVFPPNKKILVIASGKTVSHYKECIQQKVASGKYITVALNHTPDFACDYYFFSNQKRFDRFKKSIDSKKMVITSNIDTKVPVDVVLDIQSLVPTTPEIITNVAIVFFNYLISQQVREVEVAGLDGYQIKEENYNYDETAAVYDEKSLQEQNYLLKNALKTLSKKINIEFITPSIFKEDISLQILGVIPARYKSSRFEGKPLCMIHNIPMIKRTYLQAKKSKLLTKLVVATDDTKIQEYCKSENIPVVMTSETCLTGTDRIAEVAQQEHYDFYVNIQGDEPVIDASSIDEIVAEYLQYKDEYIAYNLYKKIESSEEVQSSTIIKTIVNEKDELMYMSRLGVPFNKSSQIPIFKKQVCVYGFTKKALEVFSSRAKTLNEQHEDIEILRFIDMGYKVKMKETTVDSIAVDVPEDISKVEAFLKKNGLK